MSSLERLLKAIRERFRYNPKFLASFLTGFLLVVVLRRRKPSRIEQVLPNRVSFSDFLRKVEENKVTDVLFKPETLEFTLKGDASAFYTKPTRFHPGIADFLHEKKIKFDEVAFETTSFPWKTIFFAIFPFVYLGAVVYVMKNIINPDKDSSQHMKKQKKKAKITFDDVAGINEAKERVQQVTEFFADPAKFRNFGARPPKGLLLVGPPGTGKTLLAKALATEIKCSFFYCTGSDFVEVFAGRGAKRVRDLFQKARRNSPSVIFIDEVDALGKSRSRDFGITSNDEREQTLNQLLACMDGFDTDPEDVIANYVIVLGATNRYDALDQALTRPGRFDRIIHVGLPDVKGRKEVFQVHTRKMKLEEVDFETLALLTATFSGAEIANVCNEAAISAIRRSSAAVEMEDFLAVIHEFKETRQSSKNDNFFNNLFQNQTNKYTTRR